ncbi:MAG: glycine cleavage system protein GcvH [Firmicutes bacterium]|nr:glycine cleavage system protein GcvH [Bacillota bacterium]
MSIKFTKTHEWVKFTDDNTAYIGITDYAQSELGDVVYIRLPEAGETLTTGQPFTDIESVKAVSEIFSPVDGVVSESNELLDAAPELINEAPYDTWIIKAENINKTAEFLTEEEYNEIIKG